jgi:DNA-binding IclR family transcriptional regulator
MFLRPRTRAQGIPIQWESCHAVRMANSSSGDSVTDRLVRVLETFTPTRTVQTAAEIGRRARLPGSSAHRIVGELVDSGLLERDDDRRIRIGMRLWELATRSSQALRLRQAAMPAMERVQARVREHTQLAILEQDEALFLERLSGPESGSNVTRIAGRLPLHASSSGLVLLAFGERELQERILTGPLPPLTRETITEPAALRRKLAEVRALGHAVARGFIESVSTGVAVPVRDETGTVAAALSVVLRRDDPVEPALVELHAGKRDIERSLGFRG